MLILKLSMITTLVLSITGTLAYIAKTKDNRDLYQFEFSDGRNNANVKNVLLNDSFLSRTWGLNHTSAPQAWQINQGSKDIIVAIIDTGIGEHRNLHKNLWLNHKEIGVVDSRFCRKQENPLSLAQCDKSRNGIDDSGNGLIDDVHGWNFAGNNNDLSDNHGHGTHIAGIIGAHLTEDGQGIQGVAPNVSLMILKYYDPKERSSNNLKNTIRAIRYAVDNGAHIINYSGGGTEFSEEELKEIKRARDKGILFVAAAGNERSESDLFGKHYYPANYALDNILSITAVREEDHQVLASSNFGTTTVHMAAPGKNIYSTLPNHRFGVMTGTSQATAFVSGVAALMMSHNPHLTYKNVKHHLLKTGTERPSLTSKTGTARLINAFRALTTLDENVTVGGVIAPSITPITEFKDENENLLTFKKQWASLNEKKAELREQASFNQKQAK